MSNTNWTKEQTAAIMNRNTNLLLSAAAGSGKTAVLVQRILTLITDTTQPIDITDLLVLTFTKAAATEMRTRITSELLRLLENAEQEKNTLQAAHINRQLALIESAHISTINAFCQSLIKQYFYRIVNETVNILCKRSNGNHCESHDECKRKRKELTGFHFFSS